MPFVRGFFWIAVLPVIAPTLLTLPAHAASPKQLARTYAKSVVEAGDAVGVGVAIVRLGRQPVFATHGKAMAASDSTTAVKFSQDSLFEIASMTKVFTTNLYGQAIDRGDLALSTRLGALETELGPLGKKMSKVRLKEIGDFTGGLPDYAPGCAISNVPGCLPNGRPTIAQYGASDFLAFFQNTRPRNYQTTPPSKTALPAPYVYSDFSLGLLGLILGSKDKAITDEAVDGWFRQVRKKILKPLDMSDTYLRVPRRKADRLAGGYDQALAVADVENGAVSNIEMLASGAFYSSRPKVRIRGGGGTGAKAKAVLIGERITAITVKDGGSGYIAPAEIEFSHGGATKEAKAHAIIADGAVVAIMVTSPGKGYKRVPTVTITGGRKGGTAATATARLVNGEVALVHVETPGSGYADPLSVVVAPGEPQESTIPVWAPAGALTTSLADMAAFAEAALTRPHGFPRKRLHRGFEIAQRAYACTGPDPRLSTCPAQSPRSGLAWSVLPADEAAGVPVVVAKDGALTGFTSFMILMPSQGLGVVALANSRETTIATGSVTEVAPHVAKNVFWAVYFDGL